MLRDTTDEDGDARRGIFRRRAVVRSAASDPYFNIAMSSLAYSSSFIERLSWVKILGLSTLSQHISKTRYGYVYDRKAM